jgi:catechol 2,3-dioxygenase-like lactoylglutathione lyase family enzyme
MSNRVHELRLVVIADDYDDALRFYRDVLGLPESAEFASPRGGRVTVLEAGRATLELADLPQADTSTTSKWVAESLGTSVSPSEWTTRRP